MDSAPSRLSNNPPSPSISLPTSPPTPPPPPPVSLGSAGYRKIGYQPPLHRPPGLEIQDQGSGGVGIPRAFSSQDDPTRKV